MSAVTGGALPFNGPYAQRQAEAVRAYQNALAQVNQQRNQYLGQAGYVMGPDGHMSVNTGDPYSGYNQMQTGIGRDTGQFDLGFHQGWGDLAAANEDSGVGGFQHQQFQQREGGIRNQFAQQLVNSLGRFNQADQAAGQAYNQSKLSNRNSLLDFLVRNQKFSHPKAVK